MKREKTTFASILFILFLSIFYLAQPLSADEMRDPIQVALIAEEESIQPGRPFWVALRLQMADHWHSYWKNPGDLGMPTAIAWELPPGLTAEAAEWPYPRRFDLESLVGYGYEGEVWLLTRITPAATLPPDQTATLKAQVRWLVCSDSACLPGTSDLSLQMPIKSSPPLPRKEWAAAFEQARSKLPHRASAVRAEQSGSLIQLTFDPPHSADYQTALFIPEDQHSIDAKETPLLSRTPDQRFVVALKGQGEDPIEQLKGVLLLNHSGGEEALAVDVALGKADQAIAILEKPVHVHAPTLQTHSQFEGGFGVALILAFIGGMILNLMPCVLPVVSFKILSFVKMAGQCRAKTIQHGIAFSAGVIVSFWVLAGMLLMLQAYGHSVGWGFQLQEPLFVALLAAVLLVFGLSLFGVFEIGTSLIGVACDAQQRASGLIGSFFSGVLATTVATPCTGPFLGTAVGFAVTLPSLLALAIFTFVGFGMAAPYLP